MIPGMGHGCRSPDKVVRNCQRPLAAKQQFIGLNINAALSKMGSVEMLRVSAGHPEHAWMVIQLLTILKIRQGLTGFTA